MPDFRKYGASNLRSIFAMAYAKGRDTVIGSDYYLSDTKQTLLLGPSTDKVVSPETSLITDTIQSYQDGSKNNLDRTTKIIIPVAEQQKWFFGLFGKHEITGLQFVTIQLLK